VIKAREVRLRGGSTGGAEGAPAPPTAQNSMEPPIAPPKILETIDEGREGARKKKCHQPPLPSIPGFATGSTACFLSIMFLIGTLTKYMSAF